MGIRRVDGRSMPDVDAWRKNEFIRRGGWKRSVIGE
jgi:hypothetical protein